MRGSCFTRPLLQEGFSNFQQSQAVTTSPELDIGIVTGLGATGPFPREIQKNPLTEVSDAFSDSFSVLFGEQGFRIWRQIAFQVVPGLVLALGSLLSRGGQTEKIKLKRLTHEVFHRTYQVVEMGIR